MVGHPFIAVLLLVFGVSTLVVADRGWARALILPVLAAVLVVVAGANARMGKDVVAFLSSSLAMGAAVATVFLNLYPNVLISSTSSAYNLTVPNTASAPYALTVMTVVAVIFLPLVILYQGWTYYVFRARIRGPRAEAAEVTVVTPANEDAPHGT